MEARGKLSEVVSFLPTDIQVIRLVRQVLPSGSITQVIGWGYFVTQNEGELRQKLIIVTGDFIINNFFTFCS